MKIFSFAVCLMAVFAVFVPRVHAQETAAPPRQRMLIDADWRFELAPPVVLGHAVAVNQWRWMPDDNGPQDAAQMAAPGLDTSGAQWSDAAPGDDDFHGRLGYAWFRATLPNIPGSHRTLRMQADDNADVYLNGIKLMHHEGWNTPFSVPLDSAWKDGGSNKIAVLVQNTAGGGGLVGPITVGDLPPANRDPSQVGFNDTSWRVVHLPQDYIVEGKFTPTADASHGSLPTMPAWYRKTFTLPAADRGKSVWIDFDGVYRDAKVWLNGDFLGEHQSGYIGARFDISKVAHYGGVNTLAVHVDPTAQEGWWYEGGGIYRHVWLNVANPLHVAPWGTYVISSVHHVLSHPSATLTIQTTLANAGAARPCRVMSQVFGPDGKPVASASSAVTVPAGGGPILTQTVSVPHAALWSLQQRNLYRLHTALMQNGKVIDAVDTPFGIRTIRFDPNTGFYLNDKPVKILGTCNHQDFAGVGIAVPDTLEYWRVAQLKKMGANAWRMSHNPPTPSLLDACDKEGMLVMDENRHLGDTYSPKTAPGTGDSNLSDLRDLILRDRNHPSIIMWSMCNEEPLQTTPEGARIFLAMRAKVREYDKTRPVTCAMNTAEAAGIALVEDIRGFNYNPWAYTPYHQAHPNMPLYGSETASTVSTRGVYSWDHFDRYYGTPSMGWVNAYDVNAPPWAETAEASWTPQDQDPFIAGGFLWTGFDYKGEPTPFGWPDINSNFGLIDEAGFPKDLYYYYQSWWTTKPVVHILPHWNWPGKEGQPIPVWVFSNAARVDLTLNGKDLGAQVMPHDGHLQWSVPYTPGTLVATGYDAAGKVMGRDVVATTGAPAALRLTTSRTTLAADGEDMTVVDVAVVDAQGRVVPTASNRVTFHVTGAGHVAGVGNGDPSDHDPDQADYRLAFNGLCMVLVGAGTHPGAIRLTATSPGLTAAAMRFQSH